VVLFISLIVLVAMTLAGIAMFRQVGTGVIIAGNLAFRDNSASVSDLGLEAARAWLMNSTAVALQADQAPGYYSCGLAAATCPQAAFDPASFNWGANAVQVTADDGTGNEVRYVIHRLCQAAGSAATGAANCVTVGAGGAGGSKGGGEYGDLPLTNTVQPYFRITARAAGPRNTLSYVQSIMY
jgi:type IV pilus assembly protein PilX